MNHRHPVLGRGPLMALLVLILVSTSGCPASMVEVVQEDGAWSWPSGVGRVQVDRDASSLVYSSPDSSIRNDLQVARGVRDKIARALEGHGGGPGEVIPIRFQIHASGQHSFWPVLFPCVYVGVYFGCPTIRATATAVVTYDIAGKLYVGSAEGAGWISLYYNHSEFAAWDIAAYRAIVAATNNALRNTEHAHLIDQVRQELSPGAKLASGSEGPP